MNLCEQCGYHLKMSSSDRIELSIDPGTWEPMDEDMVSLDPIEFHSEEEPYKNRIDSYQRKTGLTEAIQTGIGQLDVFALAMLGFGRDSCLYSLGLNNTHNWKHLRSCFVKAEVCNSLPKRYKTLRQYKLANLTPIEASCCRPPSQCGYPAVNASYYDLSFHPVSSNKDCKLYKNLKSIKCYSCDSCK
ncbi:hypothetical protein E3N88_41914 [Mikania micrantha]|uniref:Uncharacterized protein n=1 Tax=Mikania micrantha TaxID=192012 RepID=A0A5N6LJH1_9ASTR|nr:hypothetical protein E3N88_41914 [Mikania micrantha]